MCRIVSVVSLDKYHALLPAIFQCIHVHKSVKHRNRNVTVIFIDENESLDQDNKSNKDISGPVRWTR